MPISELKKLMNKVRKLPEYDRWKQNIRSEFFMGGEILPPKLQVHHRDHNFSWYFTTYNIQTVEDAIKCKALWEAPGICLTPGEHFALTRIALYKYPTKGFIMLLASELERLQEAQYHQRPYPKKRNKNDLRKKTHSANILEKGKCISNNRKRNSKTKRSSKV